MLKTTALIAALSTTLLCGSAIAGEVSVGALKLQNAWTRATPPTAQVAGGFMTIVNTGGSEDRLIAASSPISDRVEIHEMAMDQGVMKMRELEAGLPIPAGATVELKPGGYHVMFMGLKQPLQQGATYACTLVFEKAGAVTVTMPAAKGGAKKMMGHAH